MQPIQVQSFLIQCLKLIGVVPGSKQSAPGDQINDALYCLNEVADLFNAKGDLIYNQTSLLAPLANAVIQSDGTYTYTMGPVLPNGAVPSIVTTQERPSGFVYAAFRSTQISPFTDIPLTILSAEEYARVRVKNLQTPLPQAIYIDSNWPWSNVYFWTLPNAGGSLYLVYWQPLNSALAVTDSFSVPPGYSRLFRLKVACAMAPAFNKPVPADLASELANIEHDLSYNNKRSNELVYSGSCQGSRGRGTYDSLSDEIR